MFTRQQGATTGKNRLIYFFPVVVSNANIFCVQTAVDVTLYKSMAGTAAVRLSEWVYVNRTSNPDITDTNTGT